MVIMARIGGGATIVKRGFAAGGMGMTNRFLLGAGAALAITLGGAVGAQAQFFTMPSGGSFYVGGEGGWTWLNDSTIKPTGNLSTVLNGVANRSRKEHFDGGPVAGLRAGYEWGPWRLEEEFAYRKNHMNSIGNLDVDGTRTSYAFMTNGMYNLSSLGWFNVGLPIEPYIGAGIGAVILRDGWSAGPFTGQVRTPLGVVT